MAFSRADFVQQTTNTTGTGTYSLSGSVGGRQDFLDGNASGSTVRYSVTDGTNWEVAEGILTSGQVTRATVIASSNSGAAISWASGDKFISQVLTASEVDDLATESYVDSAVAGIVDSAPAALDTLNELAAALGDDPNFATTTATSIGEKLAKASNLSDLTNAATARTNLGLGTAATTNSTAYATAAQGTLADSALQSGDNISLLTNNSGYITGNQTITLSGDVTGSGTTSIAVTVADDSHNHVISNVDGLQTALDGKADDSDLADYLPLAGGTLTGNLIVDINGTAAGLVINSNTGTNPNAATIDLLESNANPPTFASSSNGFRIAYNGDINRLEAISYTLSTNQTRLRFAIDRSSGDASFYADDGTTQAFYWDASASSLGIGTTTPATALDVSGVITATGGNSTNWNTAYGWGDHASAGYLLSSSYTASDVLTKIKTVDGSGSGLDADLLDGQHASAFLTSESDTLDSVTDRGATTTNSVTVGQFNVNMNSTGTYTKAFEVLVPDLTAGRVVQFTFGRDLSDYDLVEFAHHNVGTSSSSNYLSIGHYGLYTNRLHMRTDGHVSIGRTLSSPDFTYELNVNGVIGATGGTSTNWNTAYSWGDHASAGYASVSTLSNYLPLTGGDITGGLVISGSGNAGGLTTASQYHDSADNLILKGNASGISGIFFQSEKDGTNINHNSDFGFIQYHPYGTGTTGESAELIIGVSNDADDHVILNAPSTTGLKFRAGASETDYTIWHSGNDGSGSGLDADTVDGIQASQFLRSDEFDQGVGLRLTGGSYSTTYDTVTTPLVINQDQYTYFDSGTGYLRRIIGTSGTTIEIGQSGTALIQQINLLPGTAGNNAVKVNGSTVWNAGNDGAGSGLDADLLDGQQGSYYLDYNNLNNKPASGVTTGKAIAMAIVFG